MRCEEGNGLVSFKVHNFKMNQLLIISTNWPAPNYSAAGVRLMQLINFFREEKYQVTIASTADEYAVNKSFYRDITLASIKLNDDSFDEFVSGLSPDVVLFDRFMAEEQFGWRVAEHAPNAIRILDTEDLHSLRKTREEALKMNIDFSETLWLQNDMTKREVASMYRCDLSLIISSYEMELLQSIIKNPESVLLHLPFMLDTLNESNTEKWKSFEERKDFVFIGFGGHAPNIDAISYLKKEIWPLIRAGLPEVNLNVYGSNFPKRISEMHSPKEGFLIKGWVESAEHVITDARLMLAPLRFGAGLKGKLVSAMQYGTPSVTTTIGAEGMHANLDWNGKTCDDPKAFAEAAIELYRDKHEWVQCQQKGAVIINTIYKRESLSEKLSSKIKAIQKDLAAHRTKNFTGEMLRHQTLTSTKYMAKWIAEKNKE